MLIDVDAIRQAAKYSTANRGDAATVATNQAKSVEVVAAVASVASRHELETPSKPAQPVANVAAVAASPRVESTPPDPGMAQLLALADRYCTATQASDKARADWRSDVQAIPPGDREGLADYLRGRLAKLVPVAFNHQNP